MRVLTAIPIYNEAAHVSDVLREVRRYASHILVVDDGSTDGTTAILDSEVNLHRITHQRNRGYGAALRSAFAYTIEHHFDVLVTMDCDGQHEPERIPLLIEAIDAADIVSGSRYLRDFRQNTPVPEERLRINKRVTAEINDRTGLSITDGFCGFKAYRTAALAKLNITEDGWGMPLQLWVQAAQHRLRIEEVGVPRLYLDPKRAFGGMLNDPDERLAYYRRVLALAEHEATPMECPLPYECWEPCA